MDDVAGQIKAKRAAAAQARRIYPHLTNDDDRKRVLAFAAELDAQADELERSVARTEQHPPTTTRTQIQMQQQSDTKPDADGDTEK